MSIWGHSSSQNNWGSWGAIEAPQLSEQLRLFKEEKSHRSHQTSGIRPQSHQEAAIEERPSKSKVIKKMRPLSSSHQASGHRALGSRPQGHQEATVERNHQREFIEKDLKESWSAQTVKKVYSKLTSENDGSLSKESEQPDRANGLIESGRIELSWMEQ